MTVFTTEAETTSKKNVNTLIKKAISSYSHARDTVQAAGMAVLEHAHAYDDCSQAKVLARGIPARERNSLIGWFSLYSPIGISMGKTAADDKCRYIKNTAKNYHDYNIEGARLNPWYEDPAKVNPEPKPLNTIVDFYDVVERILKKAIADAEKSMEEPEKGRYEPEDSPVIRAQAKELLGVFNHYKAEHLPTALGKAREHLSGKDEGQEQGAGGEVVQGPKPKAQARKADKGQPQLQAQV